MLRNFLLISYRNIRQNKGASLLNILCLALGMATCLFIFHFLRYEWSFENFHEKSALISRVETSTKKLGDVINEDALSVYEAGERLAAEHEEIAAFTRLVPYSENRNTFFNLPNYDSTPRPLFVERAYYAQASLFELFSLPLVAGTYESLDQPGNLLVSASLAHKLNGGGDYSSVIGMSLGQTDSRAADGDLTIVGVFEDIPTNTHLRFDVLVASSTAPQLSWSTNRNSYNYVLLKEPGDFELVNERLLDTDFDPYYHDMTEERWWLRPIENIHLSARTSNEPGTNTNRLFLTFLMLVGIIILVLACTNYVNNAIVNSIDRAREVGIRKLAGILPNQLVFTLLTEAALVNSVGAVLGLGFFVFGVRSMNTFTDISFPIAFSASTLFSSLGFLLILILISSIVSGFYPASLLKALKPVEALKGKAQVISSKQSSKSSRVMRGLLVFQLTMSIIFISAVLVVNQQLGFMKENNKKPFELNVTGKFPGLSGVNDIYAAQSHRYIAGVEGGSSLIWLEISNLNEGRIAQIQKIKSLYQIDVDTVGVEEDFLLHVIDYSYWQDSSRIFVSGENFDRKLGMDYDAVIINEAAMRAMNLENPLSALDTKIGRYNGYLHIKGVVKDHGSNDVPKVYVTGWRYPVYFKMSLSALGGSAENINGTLQVSQALWSKQFPHFYFPNRNFKDQSEMEQNLLKLFLFFTALAVFIACLGIFGLSSFTAIKRTKEIGIRKILGANAGHILLILIYDFMQLIFYSSVVAIPVVVIGAREWLVNYARRIEIHPLMVAGPILIMSVIAIGIIVKQCWHTSVLNPISALEHNG